MKIISFSVILAADNLSLRCFGGKEGGKFQECHFDAGYKTCFTKYENGQFVILCRLLLYNCSSHVAGVRVARGCATKRPMLYVECEAHKSKNMMEEFCYCSFDLCNSAAAKKQSWTALHILLFILCFDKYL